ncbi:hypothetical protein BC748_0049 [Flavobacterium dankookense]|uniref:Uncharacterized protein n=2 Tax=Flavobacterium dankookense TaxID=706186 RepID=A0A4R6QH10_9FLAO|nr:hypothetical protein BC748_0049 [Flavobacterium dankookense]
MAFSGVSMANTVEIEEKKVETIEVREKVEQVSLVGTPSACVQTARNAVLGAALTYNLDISRDEKILMQ